MPRQPANFVEKLHFFLECAESHGKNRVIEWVCNGRAIAIHETEELEPMLREFFSLTKYNSFRRQLGLWSFKRVAGGRSSGAFFHPYFLRGCMSLCRNVSRKTFDIPFSWSGPSDDTSITRKLLQCPSVVSEEEHGLVKIDKANSIEKCSSFGAQSHPIETIALLSSHTQSLVDSQTFHNNESDLKGRNIGFPVDSVLCGVATEEQSMGVRDGDLVCFAGKQFYFVGWENEHDSLV